MQKGNYNSTPALFLVYMVLKCCFSNAKNLFKVRFLASLMVFCDSDWRLVSNLGVPFSLFCWSLGVRSGPVTCVWVCQSLIRATMTGNIFCFLPFLCVFRQHFYSWPYGELRKKDSLSQTQPEVQYFQYIKTIMLHWSRGGLNFFFL